MIDLSNMVLKDLFFILFHTFFVLFIQFILCMKLNMHEKIWKTENCMKNYEKVWASNFEQKIHWIISYINSYQSRNPDYCKSLIHSFRPKNSIHTFLFFFILFHNFFIHWFIVFHSFHCLIPCWHGLQQKERDDLNIV